MAKVDIVWHAGFLLHRGPVDGVQIVSASPITCDAENPDGPPDVTYELLAENATRFVAQAINEDPASLELFSLTWSVMPFVDAGELPPLSP